jgi:hypothetical protein
MHNQIPLGALPADSMGYEHIEQSFNRFRARTRQRIQPRGTATSKAFPRLELRSKSPKICRKSAEVREDATQNSKTDSAV